MATRKVGDVYQSTDGLYYKVLEVTQSGCFVTRVEKPEEKPAPKKPTTRKKKAEE